MVVGEAGNGAEALEKARELSPEVVVMDLEMPTMNGLEATAAFRAEFPHIKILIFTVSDAQADLFSTMRVGARGYILKNAAAAELLRAVSQIADGGVIVSPDMATKLLQELPLEAEAPGTARGVEVLTQREAEVLQQQRDCQRPFYHREHREDSHAQHHGQAAPDEPETGAAQRL